MMQDWSKRFIEVARLVSTWSKDPSTQVGAVIVNPETKTIVAEGYNGFPRGIEDDSRLFNRELKYKLVIHAEVNAILNALYNGRSVRGCQLYVHGLPVCSDCAKFIVQSGITEVFYDSLPKDSWKESTDLALEIFKEAGVKTVYARGES